MGMQRQTRISPIDQEIFCWYFVEQAVRLLSCKSIDTTISGVVIMVAIYGNTVVGLLLQLFQLCPIHLPCSVGR